MSIKTCIYGHLYYSISLVVLFHRHHFRLFYYPGMLFPWGQKELYTSNFLQHLYYVRSWFYRYGNYYFFCIVIAVRQCIGDRVLYIFEC